MSSHAGYHALASLHISQAVHNKNFAITLSIHATRVYLTCEYFSFCPTHWITIIFPMLTFIPLLSNTAFHFCKFSLWSSIVSAVNTKSSAYRISFSILFLALPVTTSTTIAYSNADNTDPWCTPKQYLPSGIFMV